jgi:hypothetical protein
MMRSSRMCVLLRACAALLLVTMLAGVLPSPAHGQSEEMQWTVLIYYAADNNLEGQLLRELNRVEMIGSTDEVNLVTLVDRHPQYWTGSDNWTNTRLMRLEKDNNLFHITSPVIRQLGEMNTGDPETLQRFLEWGIKSYPAQHYALVIANHGGGWQGASSDESSDDQMISLAGMVRALDGGVRDAGIDKLDLLVFNACLMGELEVWSALAPYARYGVASEEVTYGLEGFESAMRDLVDDPTMSAGDLGASLVEDFAGSYVDNETGNTLTMSEIDLEHLPALEGAMDGLSEALIADADSAETILAVAQGLAHSPTFADTDREFFGMIDLRSFLLIVEKISANTKVVEAAQRALEALENVVVANYAGQDVSSVGGLSVFFPTWPRLVQIFTDGYEDVLEPVPGAAESRWIEFLNLYPDALKKDVDVPTVSPVRLAADAISEGERAEATATVGGVGLKEVDLVAGRAEGDVLITVDSNRIVLNEQEIEEGLSIPVWDAKRNPIKAWWDGTGWMLSNGEQSVRTSIQATAPGSDTFAVPGYVRSVSTGKELGGEIQFAVDVETGESTYVGAFARQESGLLGPYTFETGDIFVVERQLVHLGDGSVEKVRGAALVVGKSPLQLLTAPVPGGTYEFGMRAVNLADDSTTQLAQLRVVRESEPVEYRSGSLSFVTQRPADWLVEETVGTVTFTPDELSSVKGQVGVVPIASLGATAGQSLDDLLPGLLDVLSADANASDIQPGEIGDATLAGREARRMDYTYQLPGRGQISGSMVAFVDEPREELYVSLSEAPTATLADEQEALDLVRDNLELLPTVFVNRVYSNETMGFSLAYNDYWQVIERPASSDVFFRTLSLDAALRVQERLGKRLPTATDNDAQLTAYVEEWLKGEADMEVSEPVDVHVSALEGRLIKYSFTDETGKATEGTVTAVTTRDGRAYVLNAEVDTSSAELETLRGDLEKMQRSFTIVEPQASPVPKPDEDWLIYENQDLHFGLAYLNFLDVEEDLSDPELQVVRFTYQDVFGIEVGLIPLEPKTPPTPATADQLVSQFVDGLREELPDLTVGTLATMDLGGIPARGVSYGWYAEGGTDSAEPVEMEGAVLVAPTPYGFAYLANIYIPTLLSGDAPVDANIIPTQLGTFTPLLEGLKPVSEVNAGGQRLRFYTNARIGVSVTVPAAWRPSEQSDQVTFNGTDEIGRPIGGYWLRLQDEGQQDTLSTEQMDERLSQIIADALEEAADQLRVIGAMDDPTDTTVGALQGRVVEFRALRQGTDVVTYTYSMAQAASGRLYQVVLAVPVTMAEAQRETINRVLDSIEFEVE